MKMKQSLSFIFLLSSCASYDINSYRLNIDEETIKNMRFGEVKEFVMLYKADEKNVHTDIPPSMVSQIRKEFDGSVHENFANKLSTQSEDVLNLKLNINIIDVKDKPTKCREQADSAQEHMLGKFIDFLYGDNICFEDRTYYDIVVSGVKRDNTPIFESRIKYSGDLVANERERLNRLKSIFNKMTKYFGKIKLGQV